MADINLIPTQTFISGDTVFTADLNKLGQSNVALTAGTIVAGDLAADAVTDVKIASGVDASKLTTGTLPDDRIGANAITTARVNDAAVTAAKLNGVAKDGSGVDIAVGTAPVFGCRAWVNFNGASADNLAGTYARTGTDVTITITAHGVLVGHKVQLDFTGGTPTAAVDGLYTVTVVDDANNFHVTTAATGTSSGGTVSLLRRLIRASGNVASVTFHNAVGIYTVNFAQAMPDENYVLSGFANHKTGNVAGLVSGNNTFAPSAVACEVRVASSTSAAEQNVSHVNVMFIR